MADDVVPEIAMTKMASPKTDPADAAALPKASATKGAKAGKPATGTAAGRTKRRMGSEAVHPPADPTAKRPRPPARKTFLVAATMPNGGGRPDLRVFAAVKRTPAEALAAVRAELGSEVGVELTGKLSNRMAKTLGLKADEIRQI